MTPEQRAELKRRLWIGLWLVVAVFGGVLVGRFLAPERVETRDVERLVYRDLKVEDLTRGYSAERTRVVYRDVVTATTDAGTTITDHSIEREGENVTVLEETKRVEIVEVERERIVEKIVTLRPDWRVSVLAGASLREPVLPITGPLVIGVSAERRIAGGVSAGVWLNTVGAAGALVSVEF